MLATSLHLHIVHLVGRFGGNAAGPLKKPGTWSRPKFFEETVFSIRGEYAFYASTIAAIAINSWINLKRAAFGLLMAGGRNAPCNCERNGQRF